MYINSFDVHVMHIDCEDSNPSVGHYCCCVVNEELRPRKFCEGPEVAQLGSEGGGM